MLEHLGLVSALKALASSFSERTGLELEWRFPATLPLLAPESELVVYRVAQESLTNVARHADATRVRLSVEPARESIVLRVVDDGRGFAEEATNGRGGGLRGMRERAVTVGGKLSIREVAGGGVEVRLRVPAAEH
jgi:two-component system, NarL family, sensor histidine kinase UhpB